MDNEELRKENARLRAELREIARTATQEINSRFAGRALRAVEGRARYAYTGDASFLEACGGQLLGLSPART